MRVREKESRTKGTHLETGKHVYKLRRALGMTQQEFAFNLGVAVCTVSKWETGFMKPGPLAQRALREMATSFGVDYRTGRPL